MNFLSKLNPVNSLFGRIFLWFWLATIVIVASAVWLANQYSSNYSIRPLDEQSTERLNNIARRLEIIASRRPDSNLSVLLGRAGHRNKLALMLINPRSREIIYGFPRALGPHKEPLWELLSNEDAFRIRSNGGVYDGPVGVTLDGNVYKLFAGKPPPAGSFSRFQRNHPGVLLSVALFLSAVLCALLAWSLVRPIRELQRNAKQMAQGDLSARVTVANKRGDELGQLANDFNQMSEQLETLLGSQKRLVADISHELRSPLARLQLAIGIAQQNEKLAHDAQLQRIEKEALQIEKMIDQVLQLSRLEANMPQESLQKCHLSSLLNELLGDAAYQAQGLNKQVQWTQIPQVELNCYPDLLQSSVHNIVTNAIKYSSSTVKIECHADTDTIAIVVTDDGPGVPESELADIFTPFYRLSSSRTRDSGGVGLGLAIAQQGIIQHNGTIEAFNMPTGGLQVRIILPLHN